MVLVEDHTMLRQMLAMAFDREPEFSVVAQAGSVAEARALSEPFDIGILDIHLPDGSGLDLVRELRGKAAGSSVLMLTGSAERADLARAVASGAAGVIHKSEDLAQVVGAARRLAAGETLLSPREMVELMRLSSDIRQDEREARERIATLTPREREVLQALADGLNDAQIGERLTISAQTARTHATRILGKLEAHSRLEAILYAARHGAVRLA